MTRNGVLFVVSSPSGGGKGSILSRVMKADPGLQYSVSATTREPRTGEVDGQDYVFLSRPEFERWINEGRFVEWAEVHNGLYGTPKDTLREKLATGQDIVVELDVQGMRSLRQLGLDVVSVFIMPPSLDELERRVRTRGGLREEEIQTRLRNARREIACRDEYDYVIVNDDLDHAVKDFEQIVAQTRRMREQRSVTEP